MRRWMFFLIICLLVSGCTYYAPHGENHPVRVVKRIDVISTQDGSVTRFCYTDSKKMETVLHYLRNLQPDKYTPITPDTFRTDAYEIRLTLSDGTQTVYHQIYDEFLQKNGGRWKSIDRVQGATLPQMLSIMPSDEL